MRSVGGAHNVAVTQTMLKAVKGSHAAYTENRKKEIERKRKIDKELVLEAEAKKKKEEIEEAKKSWENKNKDLKNKLKVVEEIIKNENNALTAAVSRGMRENDENIKESSFQIIRNSQNVIQENMNEQKMLQKKLMKHQEKKPK